MRYGEIITRQSEIYKFWDIALNFNICETGYINEVTEEKFRVY